MTEGAWRVAGGIAGSWESVLDSVVVYASGALCRRRARGVVPADGRVRLPGLPRSLDPGSLRARVVAGEARVLEARLEVAATLRTPEELPELRRAVEQARDARDAVRDRLTRHTARIGEVAALRPVQPPRRRDEPHRRTPADSWLELADFVDQRLAALHARAAELEQELREARHALEVAEDRLARESSAGPAEPVETSGTAVLALAAADGEVELELEYGVPGAIWVPAYRLSHRQDDGTAELTLRASIAQRTGEDWTGVRLGFSTADLLRRTDLPKLRSLRIGRSQPAPAPSGWREPPAGLDDLFAGYDDSARLRRLPKSPESFGYGALPTGAAVAGGPVAGGPVAGGPVAGGAGRPGHSGGLRAVDEGPELPPPPPAPGGAVFRSHAVRAAPAAASMAAPGAPMAQTFAAPAPPGGRALPPPSGPPHPGAALLDYATLALAGPDEEPDRRGRLLPELAPADPIGAEQRRRAAEVGALPLPRYTVRPRESAGSFDQRYDTAAPADVPSDGTWHTVTVTELPVSVLTEYVSVPSVEETVYATLVIGNDTDRALLAGPVEVSADGEFLLTTGLPTLAPGGTRRVGLGRAEGIRIARRAELRESTAGMLNNTTVLDHRIHVELANRLPHRVVVEIRERVPVSSDQDVRIEERGGWLPPDRPSPEIPPSTRRWRVELPPGGTAERDGGYEIRIPAGKALVGGNRRS